ncbi:hypothetical protein [Nostoc sp.]|uniref:hypothetical protein n=1 Tax=Nostoc sp. TaxID=1180 RepID=UPI002FF91BCE
MNLNLTKVKQSSLQEGITEPNESEINNTTFIESDIESENNLMPSSKATLGAGMNPPPPPPPPKFP